jgi:hypothetical protein
LQFLHITCQRALHWIANDAYGLLKKTNPVEYEFEKVITIEILLQLMLILQKTNDNNKIEGWNFSVHSRQSTMASHLHLHPSKKTSSLRSHNL